MLDSSSTSLSALANALHHPRFWPSPLLGLVCFILASKRERACYNLCGGFFVEWVIRRLQVACVIDWCLVLPWDCACMSSASFAMNEPGGRHISSFTIVNKSKLKRWTGLSCTCLDFVLLSVYVVVCSKLQTRWLWYFLLPAVWPWTLEGILMYFQETQGVLPGRFKI